ncbi:MAG: autotransporter-associated beta strand repeat-containing protein [Phycisphaerales bacterium]|nr:autotransporter-associated beta strand repeat-containing protein [Phycisphaerales bacterium]
MFGQGRDGASKRAGILCAAVAGVTLGGQAFSAVNGTWKDDSGGNWSDSHWTSGSIADGVGAIADFSTLNISNDRTVTFNTSRTLGTFKISDNDSSPNESWTFKASSGKSLTLQSSSGNASILVYDGSHTISAPIILGSNLDLLINTGDSLTLSGVLSTSSGTTDLTLGTAGGSTSLGTVTISGGSDNTYSGTFTVNGGKLRLGKSSGKNSITGNLVVGDGTGGTNADVVELQGSNQIADTAAVTINSSGLLDLSDDDRLETIGSLSGSGRISLGDGSKLTVGDATNTDFSGVISGTGEFAKVGTGTLTFSGTSANSYSDDTTVSRGILALNKFNGGSGVTSIKGSLTIGDGTNTASVRLDFNDQIDNSSDVTVNANATFDLQTNDKSDRIGSLSGAGEIKLGSSSLLTFGESSSKTYSGIISGTGAVTKMGSGTQTLSGSADNTLSGLTTISSGELDLNKSGGAIAISGDVTINSGTTLKLLTANQLSSGSTVTVAGTFNLNTKGTSAGSNKLGTLAVTGGTLSTGSTTTYLTVVNDYTNTGFASGNSFDPRASGAHVDSDLQINADGSDDQTLTGDSHLSGGNTTTPTLAFGNVRVGTPTSLTVNLNWGGDTAGPKLRGAIQTGNLTGTALGITGITSSSGANFVLDHDGSTSLEVNYNSASVGSTSKTVKILNNFDDVRDQTLTISATAYRYAAGNVTTSLDFGTVHINDIISAQNVSIGNTASGDGYSDNLNASFGTISGSGINHNGALVTLGGGQTSAPGAMTIGIDTTSAGSRDGSVEVLLSSVPTQGDLDTKSLTSANVTITGNVLAYASPLLNYVSGDGSLSGGGNSYLLDLGQIDGSPVSALMELLNDIAGPADNLKGSFDVTSAGPFALSGFSNFDNIAAGQSLQGLSVGLDPSAGEGVHTGSIILHPRSTNLFYDQPLASGDITINLQGEVMPAVAVPEPTGLVLLAFTGGLLATRRRRIH